jgi:NADPH-dependent FMN reductase
MISTWKPHQREKEEMLKIGIIVGSTRPGRKAAAVAKWVHDILKTRKDAEFEIVDIEDYKLPLLDEPLPPTMHQYSNAHTKTWSGKLPRSMPTFLSPPNTTMPPRRH